MTQQKFLSTLFDADQATCFSPDAKGTEVTLAPNPGDIFFCINSLNSTLDANPSEPWHRVDLPRRADHNVICFRNFLLEIDNMPIEQQIQYVRDRVPVTAITFSGKKSYHFIISLTEPLPDYDSYMKFSRGLHRLLGPAIDPATKNPSRLSRLPGVVRPDTGLLQELVYLGSRINAADLPKFPPSPYAVDQTKPKNVVFVTQQLLELSSIGPDKFIAQHFSGRNQLFYWVGKRAVELGYTRDQKKSLVDRVYAKLENKRGFSIVEAYAAARVKT